MTKHLQVLFVFLLVIVSFHFYDFWFLNKSFTNNLLFLYFLSGFALSIPYIFLPRKGFILPIQLIILSMLVSVIMANLSWEQSYLDSIKITVPLMLWIFFFYLLHIKISIKTIEKIILIYAVIYIFLYFFQLAHSQIVLFGKMEEFTTERGVTRISIAGQGIFFLASFIALNKLTSQKHRRWFWVIISILGLVIPILQATRQYIIGMILIYLFHFIKNKTLIKKIFILTSFFGFLYYFVSRSDIPVVKGLIEAQEKTSREGMEYARIVSGTFFLTTFSHDNLSRILGNGVPSEGISDYGKTVEDLKQAGIYMSDVGIIGFYSMFGILAIIAYLIIWIKSFTLPLPKEYYYPKYYLWFLLLTSMTSSMVYHYNYLIATLFVVYIFQIKYEESIETSSKSDYQLDF